MIHSSQYTPFFHDVNDIWNHGLKIQTILDGPAMGQGFNKNWPKDPCGLILYVFKVNRIYLSTTNPRLDFPALFPLEIGTLWKSSRIWFSKVIPAKIKNLVEPPHNVQMIFPAINLELRDSAHHHDTMPTLCPPDAHPSEPSCRGLQRVFFGRRQGGAIGARDGPAGPAIFAADIASDQRR